MARTFTWTTPAGEPLVLTDRDGGYRVMAARTRGLLAPPYKIDTQAYAGVDGVELTAVNVDARTVGLDLKVEADDVATLRARVRALVRAFRPGAGDGTLAVTDEDGLTLSIGLRYTGGLEGADERRNDYAWRAVATFTATDPWFYGDDEVLPALLPPSRGFFPIFPFRFPPTAINVRASVTNAGDEDAWPTWTVTGPGTAPTLTNNTTGAVIALKTVLTAGQSLTIVTRRNYQAVTRNDGVNLFGDLTSDPALWALVPGDNDVTVTMTGATGTSAIVAAYRPRYAGLT